MTPSSSNFSTVASLGESGILQLVQRFCGPQVGDDAAVMGSMATNREMVITTDMLVEGVHFSDLTTSAYDVGWRAAAANLSDLAAMGATPWGLLLALGLPQYTPISWLEEMYQGFRDCVTTYATELVGGDTVRSAQRTLAVTAFGQVPQGQSWQRHTAQVGDAIVITGEHGLSKAGLMMLLEPTVYPIHQLSHEERRACYLAHQRPKPRLDIVQAIREISSNAPVRITAMDSSDGLGDALLQLCQKSQVRGSLDWSSWQISSVLAKVAGSEAQNWLLYGGEDFELVLCMPLDLAQRLCQTVAGCQIIGSITAQISPELLPSQGIADDFTDDFYVSGLSRQASFQHFS
jgi:thiamine-monophosphate kinase